MEVLVALALIALVLGVVAPRAVDWLSGGQAKTARIQVKSLETALKMYRLEVGRYPSVAEGLDALVTQPPGTTGWNGPYIESRTVPMDPWGRPFRYEVPGKRAVDFDLYSLGADGREGGTGDDADVGNW